MANVDPFLDHELAANKDPEAIFSFLMRVLEGFDEKEVQGLVVITQLGDVCACTGTRDAINQLRTHKNVLALEASPVDVEDDDDTE